MSQEAPTFFQTTAQAFQKSQDRTKSEGVKTGLLVFGVSALVCLGAGLLQALLSEACGVVWCMLPIGIVLGAIGTVVGIVWTLVNLLRPTRELRCPECAKSGRVYRSVRRSMCEHCGTLLRVGPDLVAPIEHSPCPYCGRDAAVTSDHGDFPCSNCGIPRRVGDEPRLTERPCPSCGAPCPEGAIFCRACGLILRTDLEPIESSAAPEEEGAGFDFDWKVGKDAIGHFYYARALLQRFAAQVPEMTQIEGVLSGLGLLRDTLMSLEEAWLLESNHAAVLEQLVEVDRLYARFLFAELSLLRRLGSQRFAENALQALEQETHVKARTSLEARLGVELEGCGAIRGWSEELVKLDSSKNQSWIKSYDGLQREVERFAEWLGQWPEPDAVQGTVGNEGLAGEGGELGPG